MNTLMTRIAVGAVAATAISTLAVIPANAAPTFVGLREITGASPNSGPCPDNSRTSPAAPIRACDLDGSAIFQLSPTRFTGTAISARSMFDSERGRWAAAVQFDAASVGPLRDVTSRSVGKSLAFVSNGRVVTFTRVNEPIRGGSLAISGAEMTKERAQQIARALGGA